MPVKETIIEVTDEWYTPELVKANPHCLFVFGDNLLGKGHGGQAVIRDLPNTFGIPTKREPNKRDTAYFSDKDEEMDAVTHSIAVLNFICTLNIFEKIIFPKNGIGTGLSHTKSKSPMIYKMMKRYLKNSFNYTFEDTE